jgi:hypothetical protein
MGMIFFAKTPSFHDWVAMKEGYRESTSGWARMIEKAVQKTEDELPLFFQYYRDYLAREAVVLREFRHKRDGMGVRYLLAEEALAATDEITQIISFDSNVASVFMR